MIVIRIALVLGSNPNKDQVQSLKGQHQSLCVAGGSGNPSIATGIGVVRAMEAALEFRNMGDLQDKKIVIQVLLCSALLFYMIT